MQKELQLKVNEKNLLANLRHAFTDRMTVASELMQNARRAGASRVEIAFDEAAQTLTVSDDGCGIADLQNLLTVAESGWDQATKDRENPYGLGFLSGMYACDFVHVASRGTLTVLDTKKLLAGEAGASESSPVMTDKTIISLVGFAGTVAEVQGRVEKFACGYALPVFFNDQEIERPDALDNGLFVETEVGMMSVYGIHRGEAGSCGDSMYGYLQGHRVLSDRHYRATDRTVIHFDPTKFHGRMPDRNCLVDAEAAQKQVKEVHTRLWREHLRERFAAMSPEDFVRTYLNATRKFTPELLNELDFIPTEFLAQAEDYPIISDQASFSPHNKPFPVRREDLESGRVTLYAEPEDLYEEGNSSRDWMFLYAKKALVLQKSLPEGHWAIPHLIDLTDDGVGLELIEPGKVGTFSGRYICQADVQLCAAYKLISPQAGEVVIEDDAIYDPERGFVVPAGECYGEAVRQVSSYIDENDCFDDECCDQDKDEMTNLLCRLRTDSPEAFFAEVLKKINLKWVTGADQQLFGKAFRVEVSPEGRVIVAAA